MRAPNSEAAPFNDLQQRLNCRRVGKAATERFPAFIRAHDVLADAEEDLRALPFKEARESASFC